MRIIVQAKDRNDTPSPRQSCDAIGLSPLVQITIASRRAASAQDSLEHANTWAKRPCLNTSRYIMTNPWRLAAHTLTKRAEQPVPFSDVEAQSSSLRNSRLHSRCPRLLASSLIPPLQEQGSKCPAGGLQRKQVQ